MAKAKTETPEAELRTAAVRAREDLVDGATTRVFHDTYVGLCADHDELALICKGCTYFDVYDRALARLIAALINAREPLASWLETVADQFDAPPCDAKDGVCNGCEWRPDFNDALAVARALNGSTP